VKTPGERLVVRVSALLVLSAYAGCVGGLIALSGKWFQADQLSPLVAFLSLLGAGAFPPTGFLLAATVGTCWLLIRSKRFLLSYLVVFVGCGVASYFGTAAWTTG
jgi:hypothetical protein